jgi:hypothetical protein
MFVEQHDVGQGIRSFVYGESTGSADAHGLLAATTCSDRNHKRDHQDATRQGLLDIARTFELILISS